MTTRKERKCSDIIRTVFVRDSSKYEILLDSIKVSYTVVDVMSNFWGRCFTIQKPKGKGAAAKLDIIYRTFG